MLKHLFRLAIMAFMAIGHCLPSMAAESAVVTVVKNPLPDIDDDDKSSFGSRTPARPLFITIDFDSEDLILPMNIDDVVCYAIRTEDMSAELFSSTDVKEFVRALASFSYPVSIVLTTDSYILTGYFQP